MLYLEDSAAIKEAAACLKRMFSKHLGKYIKLFFLEEDLDLKNLDVSPLLKTRILRNVGKKMRANVQVFPLHGFFICTDFLYSKHRRVGKIFKTLKDGVWAILPDESPVIAQSAIVKPGDKVLDLATGSGIIALFCARVAEKVIATDINPRAIHFAKFNAILNSLEDKIEFRLGDLFEPVKGEKFDLIIWNGPTVAVPNVPEKYPTYCFGGMDGAHFTKRFINQALNFLKEGGRLQWYDCAVGDKDLPVSMRYLEKKWKNTNLKVSYYSLTKKPVSLKKAFHFYEKWNLKSDKFKTPLAVKSVTKKEELHWHNWLEDRGYTHVFFGLVTCTKSREFQLKTQYPEKDIRVDKYLTKYWLFRSYATIRRWLAKLWKI